MMSEGLEAAALHEAGHVAALREHGIRVVSVTIQNKSDGTFGGRVNTEGAEHDDAVVLCSGIISELYGKRSIKDIRTVLFVTYLSDARLAEDQLLIEASDASYGDKLMLDAFAQQQQDEAFERAT